jgi:IS1 family transposase
MLVLSREKSWRTKMNTLKKEKRLMVLSLLVEGNSIRSIERITGVHRDTILRFMKKTGHKCQNILNSYMQNLSCKEIECDEIWTYVAKKQRKLMPEEQNTEKGDQYVFVALDPRTKLIPVFTVGKRSGLTTLIFMQELKKRIINRFQLTTDRFIGYFDAVDRVFGIDIDYAQLQKIYAGNGDGHREGYTPSEIKGVEIIELSGKPKRENICTSYIERQNLTIRMQMRRFTRLTNAFSKKLENLKCALALHFFHYNFMRIHQTLRLTPAMESGITDHIWSWENILTSN